FLRASFSEHVSIEDLLMKPSEAAKRTRPVTQPARSDFENEPHTDFSRTVARNAMQEAIDDVVDQFGQEYPLIIGGKRVETKGRLTSRNPSHRNQVIGYVASATADDAADSIAAARAAFPAWSRLETQYRAEYIELVAAEMRQRRF